MLYTHQTNCPDRKLYENERIGIKPRRDQQAADAFHQPPGTEWLSCSLSHSPAKTISSFTKASGLSTTIYFSAILSHRSAPAKMNSFMHPDQMKKSFRRYPGIIENTVKLLDDCNLSFDLESHKNKKLFSASRYDDKLLLEKLAWDGMMYRYGRNNSEARKRISHELEIIDKLGFSAYFLITWDIVRYSMARGFYHVGRGSGANSIVAYCLKITNVDPIDLNLYFERFINPKRSSPSRF